MDQRNQRRIKIETLTLGFKGLTPQAATPRVCVRKTSSLLLGCAREGVTG
jgi:hypothetical protein